MDVLVCFEFAPDDQVALFKTKHRQNKTKIAGRRT
jgi:hypothetical protein